MITDWAMPSYSLEDITSARKWFTRHQALVVVHLPITAVLVAFIVCHWAPFDIIAHSIHAHQYSVNLVLRECTSPSYYTYTVICVIYTAALYVVCSRSRRPTSAVSGFRHFHDVITEWDEACLIKWLERQRWAVAQAYNTTNRQELHYMHQYDYSTRSLRSAPAMPTELALFMYGLHIKANQVTIHRCPRGTAPEACVDSRDVFDPTTVILFMGRGLTMGLRRIRPRTYLTRTHPDLFETYLPPRSLVVLDDWAQYTYTREIKPHRDDDTTDAGPTLYTITFRNLHPSVAIDA